LGQQLLNGRQTEVVYFTQIPERARITAALNSETRTIKGILVQGVAWIDAANYQIVRMQTDLLEPEHDMDLRQLTTDSEFAGVRFQRMPHAIWLPEQVTVTVNWRGWNFRNQHNYSDFQLFEVDTNDSVH
jgi:hypothetical protein